MTNAERRVEAARRVPIEDIEVEPRAAALERQPGEIGDELAPDAVEPRRRPHIEILEVDPGAPLPGRVVVEEEGEADRLAIDLGDARLEARASAEPVAQEICL